MKRIVCLFLTICLFFLVFTFSYPRESLLKDNVDTSKFNLCSVSDFTLKLENENIDINDSNTYNIYVLVQKNFQLKLIILTNKLDLD